jgi:hypothetical protein
VSVGVERGELRGRDLKIALIVYRESLVIEGQLPSLAGGE